MSTLVESLRRLYLKNRVSIEKLKEMVLSNRITQQEYEYIIKVD